VRRRYDRILENPTDYCADAAKGLRLFKVWDYRRDKMSAWSQPLLSYEYDIESLPPDEQLRINLESLATALIDAP